ncbi:ubiquitin elongating factor core-domain-containing protein [Fimicolochytrium jonesii]|uniref:ubiquitin elongating factor core-domain-containing protein n=1 Tax=Fimicolochytrium jonesii TaxID=1396493 RepID=UPI0022FED016|nr:ubiquitin elongating factor core-domain-containing protein [Fimicolochytrium jonesii]KAI8823342.1 ubiquitin elongating factor core-domain-containing protein [Fimicolochytrium jonesii]
MEDAEQIRRKRLERMAKLAATSASPASPTPAGSSPATPTPAVTPTITALKQPLKVEPKAAVKQGPQQTNVPSPSPKFSPSAATARILADFLERSQEDWENEVFEDILQCCLRTDRSSQKRYTDLADVRAEMEGEGLPLKITKEQVERALYARLSLQSNEAPNAIPLFDYLVGAWKRSNEARRRIEIVVEKVPGNEQVLSAFKARTEALSTLQELILNYSALVVNPDMNMSFPQPQSVIEEGPSLLAKHLLLSNQDEADEKLPPTFLEQFFSRFQDDQDLLLTLQYMISTISADMRQKNLLKDYNTPLRALHTLISQKKVASLLPNLPQWKATGGSMEVVTVLGPFFGRLTAFPGADPTLAEHYFGSGATFGDRAARMSDGFYIGARNPGDVKSAMTSLRSIVQGVQHRIHGLVMTIIKSAPEAREGVLQYFGTAIESNVKRGRMQVDPHEVSSDGFMYSLLQTSLLLTDPIMDSKYSKLHLIDPDYFTYSTRIDLSEQTRINIDKEQYEQHVADWKASHPDQTAANFVSDIFFVTLAMHHYGILSTIRTYGSLIKQTEELRKHVDKMVQDRNAGVWAPGARVMNEGLLKRFQKQLDIAISFKLCMDTGLRDRGGIAHSLRFYDLVMMWLLRCLSLDNANVHHPAAKTGDAVDWAMVARGEVSSLTATGSPPPAPFVHTDAPPPVTFASLPEWIIEDICEYYLFVARYEGPTFETVPRDVFLTFTMSLLANPHYIKNPHLKSKFVEILFTFTWPLYRTESGEGRGFLDGIFCTHPLAKELLVENLMRFYVDAEHTGASSQFYDKFNIRYNISQVLKSIWADAGHKKKVVLMSQNTQFFTRFAALLMNDATYLLDESLSKLKQIQQIQHELETPLNPNATQEEQTRHTERAAHLKQLEGQAVSYMSLGNETVHMLQYMTANPEIVQPFMEPEIVERLAAMLDFNIAAMVGPRCTDLKVKKPEKYRFEPKKLLKELVEIYLNLAHRPEFVTAVARDERSYKRDHFIRAGGILLRNGIKNEGELQPLHEFIEQVEREIVASHEEEEELGEIPDEFLDPLLFHLMEDPVKLPSSGQSVDRSTIKSYLLGDKIDPFNRQPLSIDQVIPDTELKQKIQEWRRSRRSAKTNATSNEGGGDVQAMDTS